MNGDTESDWINNFWLGGPGSSDRRMVHEYAATNPLTGERLNLLPDQSVYIRGNIAPAYGSWPGLTDPNADNWVLIETNENNLVPPDSGNPVPLRHRRFTPLSPAPIPVTIEPADDQMLSDLLAKAGAYRRLNPDGTWVVY